MKHVRVTAADAGPAANVLTIMAQARWVVPALFALTLGLRAAVILVWPQTPFSDGAWYLARAAEMAHGLGYQEAGHPTAFWPVGFPALLALAIRATGSATLAPIVINMAGAAATLALILWFARAVGAGPAASRIAGLLYAIYPAPVVYAGVPMSEVSATALAMAAFALLIAGRHRWPLAAGAGLLFGVVTLMRAQMLFFPIGAIVALMLVDPRFGWRRAARALVLVYLPLAAVVLPWTLRNERLLGVPVLVSTNGGATLVTGAYDGADGNYVDWEQTPSLAGQVGVPFSQRIERQVELDRRLKAMAETWIAAHPLRWTVLGIKKAALVWHKDSDAFWAMQESYPDEQRGWTAVAIADQLFYLALLVLACPALVVGVRGILRRDPRVAPLALLGCMPAFVTLTGFVFTGQTRFHFPAMPFVIVAAGWTLAQLVSRRSGSDRPAA